LELKIRLPATTGAASSFGIGTFAGVAATPASIENSGSVAGTNAPHVYVYMWKRTA